MAEQDETKELKVEAEIGAKLERTEAGWTLTLIADKPQNKVVLEELLRGEQFDDHPPTFVLSQAIGSHGPNKTEVEFVVRKGPDVTGPELDQLYTWKPTPAKR